MKSLVLKDLYNMAHYVKTQLLVLAIWTCLIPSIGLEAYPFACVVYMSMMNISTFALDDAAGWMRYALITPVSRRDAVLGKFVTLAVFCGIGVAVGLTVTLVAAPILGETLRLAEVLLTMLSAWSLGMAAGGTVVPLVLKFGAEKTRVFMMLSMALPVGGIVLLGTLLGDTAVWVCMPVIALLWDGGMYLLACRILEGKDVA